MHPFFEGLRPTLHIAHRGGALVAPENTLYAFHKAVAEYRTDMLELDVHRTADGELVVSHDPTVDRCTDGTGAISAMTVAELRKLDAADEFSPDGGATHPLRNQGIGIPTLREVLRAFPKLRMNIDLKDLSPGTEQVLAQVLTEEAALDRVCIGTEDDVAAARLYEALPQACHFYPRNALIMFVMRVKNGEAPPDDSRFTVLDMPLRFQGIRLIDAALLQAAHEQGKWINVWTVDDPEDMRRCILEGVGGIMTDRPDLLRAALDKYR